MNKLGLMIACVLLCGGSLFCSVALWVGTQDSLFTILLAGVFSGALELCKFVFFPVASRLWVSNKAFALLLYFLSLFLLVVSIVATVSFLETGVTAEQGKALKQSVIYQSARSELVNLNKEMDSLNKLISKDTEIGYRKRAYEQSERLTELHSLIAQKVEVVKGLEVNESKGLFGAMVMFFDQPLQNVRLFVFLLVALLVDVCGIVCLLLLTKTDPRKHPKEKKIANLAISDVTKEDLLKQEIKKGKYGIKLVVRNIVSSAQISFPVLKRVLSELIEEGAVIKVNNRYELVEAE